MSHECGQGVVPERVHPCAHRTQTIWIDPVEATGADRSGNDQAGVAQGLEMLGNGRLRDRHVVGEFADAPLAVSQQLEYSSSRGVVKNIKCCECAFISHN